MLAPSPIIKKAAREVLAQRFLEGIAVSCILVFTYLIGDLALSLLSSVADIVLLTVLEALFFLFVLSPLFIGVVRFFYRVSWGEKDSAISVFKYFSNLQEYKRALHLILILTIKLICAGIILFLPCIIVWMLSSEWFYDTFNLSMPIWTSSLLALNLMLAIVAIFALCFVMLKYYLSTFLFVSDENMDPAEVVNMSTIISRRTGGDFFGLVLSFFVWILLSLFIAPIIFVLPYFATAYVIHCRHAVTAYNSDVDLMNSENAPFYRVDEV